MNASNDHMGLAPVISGEISPGSPEGRELIQEALKSNPEAASTSLSGIKDSTLEEHMRAAGIPEDQREDILSARTRTGADMPEPEDPFEPSEASAGVYDPVREMQEGPRFPGQEDQS